MRTSNDLVGVFAKLVVPVEGEVVSGSYFDGIVGLHVAHYVAAHVDGVKVLDWRVVVTTTPILTVVGGDANTFEGSLVDPIDKDTLSVLFKGGL